MPMETSAPLAAQVRVESEHQAVTEPAEPVLARRALELVELVELVGVSVVEVRLC